MEKTKDTEPVTFWTEDRLRTARTMFMMRTDISYLQTLQFSHHGGVVMLPEDSEIVRVTVTPKGDVFIFVVTSYPDFLGLMRHETFEQRMRIINSERSGE
jgi:hypothetical protein